MTPTFSDFFKSFYYSNTYVKPVDLSEAALSKHLLQNENQEVATIAQRLISNPEVQQVLSQPLTYDLVEEIPKKNAILVRHGFKLLSYKPNLQTGQQIPFYSVIEHDELKGWIIKSGATRVPKGELLTGPINDKQEKSFFTDEESLLRIEMSNRIQKVAKEANIDVVLPKKKLVSYANLDGVTEPNRKYCVVCEKINILSVNETVQAIKNMGAEHQKEIARKISTIIQGAGLVDASFDNIRLTTDGKLAFIDTEPAGLMVAKKPNLKKQNLWSKVFDSKGPSIEKCARIGLFTLMHQTSKATRGSQTSTLDALQCEPGLQIFRNEVQTHYKKAISPKLSKWKIILSIISFGIFPLIIVFVALKKTKLTKRTFEKLQATDHRFNTREALIISMEPPIEQARLLKEHNEKRTSIVKQFYAYIEGVPYSAVKQKPTFS